MSSPVAPAPADLRGRLAELTIRDERRLRRRLEGLRKVRDDAKRAGLLHAIGAEVAAAESRVGRRRAGVPVISYPEALPVSQARDELLEAIRDHQVVVIAGETGSGKTTQLPKLCLELGRGVRGRIGHTQPRRIAARSVAARIAEELGVDVGQQVGSQVRFDDRTSEATLVKVMTDGILLAEIQRDPALRAYDTIILDEAHERSLTIDFLLGYLAQLLPRRPDLKLIITSATIDPERFAQHFGGAPVLTVSGRTYPVEVRYRPDDPDDPDQVRAIGAAVTELLDEGPGDILVFLSGEREIRDTADALRGMNLPDTEILPLYGRLSTAEQQRVFRPHRGRRVVLATNVAETSLTVPGIRYVVDPGTARISRYSSRTKVQRLPIEKVSQASADQRKGRCGRVADGICIRLYAEEDFEARPEFTEPEILRTNLASVILQMAALGLGDVEEFPFLDPPERRSVRDAVLLLHELGAVTRTDAGPDLELTEIGRALAALPVDPRLGRMLIEADRNACLTEVLVIVAGLSIQDPRERPPEQRKAADEQHARFADETSDFLSLLELWRYLRQQQHALSGNAFRRRCRSEHLHHLRVREWQDVHSQLRAACKDLGMTMNEAAAEGPMIHRSLLAGLLSQIGLRDGAKREYIGARGTRFLLWPGSALADAPPSWVMAAELVETSRPWARTAAVIEPEWAEQLAPHLIKRTYSEPRWSAKRGSAVADEKVTLYGVPLVAARRVSFARIDPELSRELFIRHALVQREWRSHHRFLADNAELLAELSGLEDRTRRRDIVADDDVLYAFYDARVPADVVSARDFDRWWKDRRTEQPDLLTFTKELLLEDAAAPSAGAGYPDEWHQEDLALPLSYRFEPGAEDDGVTVHVPLAVLNRVRPEGFEWQVPALRAELVTALLRGLPKEWRRSFVPIPDVARAVLGRLDPTAGPLLDVLSAALHQLTGVAAPREVWRLEDVPDHLRISFRVHDGAQELGRSRDLAALQHELAGDARSAVAGAAAGLETTGHRSWAFGSIPRTVTGTHHGVEVEGYPALVDEGDTVGLRVLLSRSDQHMGMWQGTRRLLALDAPPPVRAVGAALSNTTKLALSRNPHGSVNALLEDCLHATIVSLLAEQGGPVWDADAWARLRAAVARGLQPVLLDVVRVVEEVLTAADAARRRLDGTRAPAAGPAVADARAHLEALVHPGFVTGTGRQRLPDVVRYLQAIAHRVEKAAVNPRRDAELRDRVTVVREEHLRLLRRLGPSGAAASVREIRWMIEELRVSLFAQHLGTRYAISEQRVFRAIAEAEVALT